VLQGRRVWLRRLVAAGRLTEAEQWAKRHRLPWPPPPAAAETPPPAAAGGEGVSLDQPPDNWDKTAPIPQILQSPVAELTPAMAVAAVVAAALADPALAAGGGEGGLGVGVGAGAGGLPVASEEGSRQEESATPAVAEQLMTKIDVERKWGNFPNLQDGQVIGVVGRRCRNKWYVEVKVGEEWGKAEIGQWVVHPNDWVIVELAWASADGRDKEWRIVANIDAVPVVAPEPVVVAKLEDFDSGEPEVPTPAEQEHPSAADFMEQARRAAYAAYAR